PDAWLEVLFADLLSGVAVVLVFAIGGRFVLKICEKHLQPGIRLDEALAEVVVFCEQVIAFHLVNCLAIFHRLSHERAGCFEHIDILPNILRRGNRSVARDYFGVPRNHAENFLATRDHAADAAAILYIDKWKTISDEIITHVYYFGFGKEDDT